jgi:hypothetical protein
MNSGINKRRKLRKFGKGREGRGGGREGKGG